MTCGLVAGSGGSRNVYIWFVIALLCSIVCTFGHNQIISPDLSRHSQWTNSDEQSGENEAGPVFVDGFAKQVSVSPPIWPPMGPAAVATLEELCSRWPLECIKSGEWLSSLGLDDVVGGRKW